MTLTLADEIDISRGDLLTGSTALPSVAERFRASLVWMGEESLQMGRRYLLKHGSRLLQSSVAELLYRVDLANVSGGKADGLVAMNAIAEVVVETLQPLVFDPYAANRHTGSFVLIDLQSNTTVAAGMIRQALEAVSTSAVEAHEVVLKGGHPLQLQGSAEAVSLALAALRGANLLREDA